MSKGQRVPKKNRDKISWLTATEAVVLYQHNMIYIIIQREKMNSMRQLTCSTKNGNGWVSVIKGRQIHQTGILATRICFIKGCSNSQLVVFPSTPKAFPELFYGTKSLNMFGYPFDELKQICRCRKGLIS